jgi:hypothetical protein
MENNPLGKFVWETRVQLVYKPLFKTKGLKDVLEAHEKYLANLRHDSEEGRWI